MVAELSKTVFMLLEKSYKLIRFCNFCYYVLCISNILGHSFINYASRNTWLREKMDMIFLKHKKDWYVNM